jgi:polypeptide N-acetylgalactosaminyltransferase
LNQVDPDRFLNVDPEDLTKAKLVKEKLKCKPFQYFLENIAPDMYERYFYQLQYPGNFAWGSIQSDAFPGHCLDFMGRRSRKVQLYKCKNLKKPKYYQNFKLTWHKKLRLL